MAKTKTPPKKAGYRCIISSERFESTAEWTQHTVECATKKRESLVFECPHCDHSSKRKRDLDRHIKRAHNDKVETVSSDSSADESDWKTHDPGTLQHIIGEPEGHGNIAEAKGSGDLEEERIIWKPTIPMPIFAPASQSVLDGQLKRKSVFDYPQSGCSTVPCDKLNLRHQHWILKSESTRSQLKHVASARLSVIKISV
ncbi:hypothetical protein FSP39_010043 [Pinctada imbricata]|uniref:C2H2-type domain-containing protein n=1 Tax=Pinctada imbricata TaxID=66713 RepID=A0AA88YM88_PINIB|nr:hypothetical protein FSP39_010043 [Pinctada imbricata]